MNTTEKEIDRLTRGLLKEGLEQPSASLNFRIMARVMSEKRQAFTYHIRRLPSAGVLVSFFVAYMVLVSGGLLLLGSAADSGAGVLHALGHYYPLLLTVCAGFSFCYFFAELDGWLRHRQKAGRTR